MGSVRKALPPLLVGVLGVGIGWLFASGYVLWTAVVVVSLAGAGWGVQWLGTTNLPRNPARSQTLFEWSLIGPFAAAALVAGVLLWYAVAGDVFAEASDLTQKSVAALATAVTTAVTAVFIKGAEDADETWIAKKMRSAFREAYGTSAYSLKADTATQDMVFGGDQGWSRDERKKIADAVQAFVDSRGE